jgi:hypothetical protein
LNNNSNKADLQKTAKYENMENILHFSNLGHGIPSLSFQDRHNPQISTVTAKSRFRAEKEIPAQQVTCAE